jgi:hypothetical protein
LIRSPFLANRVGPAATRLQPNQRATGANSGASRADADTVSIPLARPRSCQQPEVAPDDAVLDDVGGVLPLPEEGVHCRVACRRPAVAVTRERRLNCCSVDGSGWPCSHAIREKAKGQALYQAEAAHALSLPPSNVREEVERLVRAGLLVRSDVEGSPRVYYIATASLGGGRRCRTTPDGGTADGSALISFLDGWRG